MALIMTSFSLACSVILFVDVVCNEHLDSSHFPAYFVKSEADVFLKIEQLYCHVSRIGHLTFWHRNYFFNFSTPVYKM